MLTELQAHQAILQALAEVAPEADTSHLDPARRLQDQLDIDSMDFLNVMTALHRLTGVDVPERDYPQVASLAGCIRYLLAHHT